MPWGDIVIDAVFFPGAVDGDKLKLLPQEGMEWVGYSESSLRFVAMECS
jgi:hypothetical protein